jgi:large subunit ribosomal protein L9
MKVLLIKDVYKLGHAGDVKKVADGYGRNFLLPQGLAVLATAGALTTVEKIRAKAAVTRAALNQEMGGLAEQIEGVELFFTSKAGETGKLYGSVTTQMISDELNKKMGTQIERHQVEVEPIRMLGEHIAIIRLTIDLNPKVKVFVTREGEVAEKAVKATAKQEDKVVAAAPVAEAPVAETIVEELVVEEPVVVDAVEEVTVETPETKVPVKKSKTEKPVEVEASIEETKAE